MENKPTISIVILTWNGQDVIEKNISSLQRNLNGVNYELIVVDNGSTDRTLEIVRKFDDIILVENKENLGFAKGNNIGIKKAQGKYILLLNQDVECIDGAISKLLDFLERNSFYGAVAPQLLYPDGKIQISCRPFYNFGVLLKEIFSGGKYKNEFYNHNISQEVDQPMASVLLIRAELLKKIGGFDEHPDFWLYFNDVDLSYQINQAGLKNYFLAEAKFYHYHGESTSKIDSSEKISLWTRGLRYYFLKHHIKSKLSLKFFSLLVILFFLKIGWNLAVLFKVKKIGNKK